MATVSYDLLAWLKLFWTESTEISYESIGDGYFLNEVFREIDSNAQKNEQFATKGSPVDFVKNWEILITNIRVYYTVVLQQAVLIRLPSIITIFHDTNTDKTIREINTAIFLILGAAVQCERKEYFIQDIITRLSDESIQHGLMGFIKQITEETETVISYLHLDELPKSEIIKTLRKITEDWEQSFLEDTKTAIDHFDELIRKVTDQQNQIQVFRNVGLDNGLTNINSSSSDKNSVLELAESKAKIRKLQNELDDKTDLIADLREDLDMLHDENLKLKECQIKWTNDARKARMLQDELDSQQESMEKHEIISKENQKLKEKVNELEYYRARCEELREDLSMLSNENNNLTDKLETEKLSTDKLVALEFEYKKSMKKIDDQDKLISDKLDEIHSLNNEIFGLHEKDSVNTINRSTLERELKIFKKDEIKEGSPSSLSDQIAEKSEANYLRMEIENRKLREKLANNSSHNALSEKEVKHLKEENKEISEELDRMKEKVNRLQESNRKDIENIMVEKETKELAIREKHQYELKIESMKENEKRRVEELMKEIENLNETIFSLRERSEKSNDSRINDLEKENSRLHTSLNEANHRLSKLEFDLQCQTQKSTRLDAALEKSQQEHLRITKENADLNKELNSLKFVRNSLEDTRKSLTKLELENVRLQSLITQHNTSEYDSENKANSNGNLVEEDMHQMMRDHQDKNKQLLGKITELNDELVKAKNDKETGSRQMSTLEKKLKLAQDELDSCRMEIDSLSKLESKLKLAEKNQQELTKERSQLQAANLKLEQDLKKLERDFRKLKSQNEVQSSSIEKYKQQISELEVKIQRFDLNETDKDEMESLQKSLTDSKKRLIDVDQKNRELYQQAIEEKRKSDTLREDLLNEKLEANNLRNQLHSLQNDIDALGLSEENSSKNEKFDLLENKFNVTIKETINKKDGAISSLNSKLSASVNRNKELSVKLEESQLKYESLQQKYEEELEANSARNSKSQDSKNKSGLPVYLNELKDRLIILERQNAELATEKQHLGQTCEELKKKVELEESNYKSQFEALSSKYQTTKEHNMKMEVETSTMRSQLTTLRSENVNLSEQISNTEKNLFSTTTELNGLHKVRDKLESQYETLEKINEKLSREYEEMKIELNQNKSSLKVAQSDLQSREKELVKLRRDAESVKQLRDILENEKGNYADSARVLITIRQDNEKISQENKDLLKENSRLESQLRSTTQEMKHLRNDKNKDNDEILQLREANAKLHRQEKQYQVEIVKLKEKIEHLLKENSILREENQKLLQQMKSMLTQNHELLTETLQHRASHYSEENALRDKLNNLQRQKERLEEKIMEHYKSAPQANKPKSGTNKFFKKAKDLLKRKDSKTSLVQKRTSPVDLTIRAQRSKSCVTILEKEPGDDSCDDTYADSNWNDSPERSKSIHNNNIYPNSDQEQAIIHDDGSDISDTNSISSTSTKQYYNQQIRMSRTSDGDTNSLFSSLSHQLPPRNVDTQYSPLVSKLQPGSMSMYDRDESERRYASEMADWLDKHNHDGRSASVTMTTMNYHNQYIPNHQHHMSPGPFAFANNASDVNQNYSYTNETRKTSITSSNIPNTNATNNNNNNNVRQNYTNLARTNPRSQSSLDNATRLLPSQQRILPQQPKESRSSSSSQANPILFGNISSKQQNQHSNTADPNVSQRQSPSPKKVAAPPIPNAPARKSSLPVTDRQEEDVTQMYLNSPISARQSAPPQQPPHSTNSQVYMKKHPIPVISNSHSSRSMSTTSISTALPTSASSKAILQRMNKQQSQTSSTPSQKKANSNNIKLVRPATPNNDMKIKDSRNKTPSSTAQRPKYRPHSTAAIPISLSSQTIYQQFNQPPVPLRTESHRHNNDKQQATPVPNPPLRRESANATANRRNSGNALNSNLSSSSTNSEADPSLATLSKKQKIYYQYGNV